MACLSAINGGSDKLGSMPLAVTINPLAPLERVACCKTLRFAKASAVLASKIVTVEASNFIASSGCEAGLAFAVDGEGFETEFAGGPDALLAVSSFGPQPEIAAANNNARDRTIHSALEPLGDAMKNLRRSVLMNER